MQCLTETAFALSSVRYKIFRFRPSQQFIALAGLSLCRSQ